MSRRTSTRPQGVSSTPSYSTDLREAIRQFLPRSGLALVVNDDKLRWVPRMLVTCAILMTWDLAGMISDAFERARGVLLEMYSSRRRPGESYGGFMATLAHQTAKHLALIIPTLRQHVRALAESCDCWRVDGWCAFGVDGSRIECPMSAANEAAFGTAGRKKTGPQQFLTTLFHVASGLIWDFRRGEARASERAHLLEMLDDLPPEAMLLADAGFTGYEFLQKVMHSGRSLLVRVGSNVQLLLKLGWCCDEHEGIVYLWPDKARKREQAPLVLRLITLIDGRNRRIDLLSNVLDREVLSDASALALYRKRWGVELIYRSLKQTMGKRKLRCDAPANAVVELQWSVIGLWLLGLMSVSRIAEGGVSPGSWSVACSLRVVRRVMAGILAQGSQRRPSLKRSLALAVKDQYLRHGSKEARHWPHKKKENPPGQPRARMALEPEIKLAAELRERRPAA
jgi:Transposase DDE domain